MEERFEAREGQSGRATIEIVLRMLRAVLGQAVKDERIARNPASGISISAPQERAACYLSAAEVSALAGAVPEKDRALVLLLSYAGLRIGEAAALRVKHVDLFRQRLIVEASAGEVRGHGWIEGKTKTDQRRAVFLPPFLRDELMRHLAAFSDPSDLEARVFRGPDGGALRSNNWRKRVFYPACARVGLDPAPHVHDLRHTAASLAIAAGAHPKAIQEMLGHAKIEMTLGRYGHLFETLQEQTAARLDAMYRESAGN
jgi:integrase